MMYTLSKIIAGTLADLYIRRFDPVTIGVTGNAGKTSTKEMIGAVVGKIKKVRVGGGNLNNEVGLPFNIISASADEYYETGGGLFFGVKEFFKAVFGLFGSDYPEVLVLEYGADHPGDIKRLAAKFPPHISVVTTVGDTPVHIEFFKNAEALADEKANLLKVLSHDDYAILNHDDRRVAAMHAKTKARTMTYGFGEGSTVLASDFEYRMSESGKPEGVTFKLHRGSNFVPVVIEGSLGKSQAYSAAAAAAVGTVLGMNMVQISDALGRYRGPNGRLKIIPGINNSTIIDDSYNASPASTRLALETLRDLPGLRKVAVLGDMLELGSHSEQAHGEIGELTATCANILVCVGSRTRAMADAAVPMLGKDNVYHFETSDAAKTVIRKHIREHDLVLVKGSQGVRMEKIVAEIMADPARKKELLVRQSARWLAK